MANMTAFPAHSVVPTLLPSAFSLVSRAPSAMSPPAVCALCPAPATVHCPADSANLCASCDLAVHSANTIVHRHVRTVLCRCCAAPTTVQICGLPASTAATPPCICASCMMPLLWPSTGFPATNAGNLVTSAQTSGPCPQSLAAATGSLLPEGLTSGSERLLQGFLNASSSFSLGNSAAAAPPLMTHLPRPAGFVTGVREGLIRQEEAESYRACEQQQQQQQREHSPLTLSLFPLSADEGSSAGKMARRIHTDVTDDSRVSCCAVPPLIPVDEPQSKRQRVQAGSGVDALLAASAFLPFVRPLCTGFKQSDGAATVVGMGLGKRPYEACEKQQFPSTAEATGAAAPGAEPARGKLGKTASARLRHVLLTWQSRLGLQVPTVRALAFHMLQRVLLRLQPTDMAAESLRVLLAACLWVAAKNEENQKSVPKAKAVAAVAKVPVSRLAAYLPSLACLNLSRNPQVNDTTATAVIPWIRSLRHLDLSHTAVTSASLDSLTYGARLKGWRDNAQEASKKAEARKAAKRPWWEAATDATPVTDPSPHASHTKRFRLNQEQRQQQQQQQLPEQQPQAVSEERQQEVEGQEQPEWRECCLVYLRLQGTLVDRAGATHLLGLSATVPLGGMFCLDVRDTPVKGDVLSKLRSTFHLLSPPNEPRLLCRTNALALNILRTYPGTASEPSHRASSSGNRALASGGWDRNEGTGERLASKLITTGSRDIIVLATFASKRGIHSIGVKMYLLRKLEVFCAVSKTVLFQSHAQL
ncbi:unnamed protein product [Closterium sp. Naga37s-1]|nr:unnamed protein product [Closterium sp. Naga37s-1]